jgi:hypothetical protein
MAGLQTRVSRIAEESLAEQRYVIDVLVGLGWLAQPYVDRCERGRVPSLDRCVGVDSDKIMVAFAALKQWADERGLKSSEGDYQDLQFTADAPSPTDHRDLAAQRMGMCVMRRHWRLPSYGKGGFILSGLRRSRPPRVSTVG